jgi:hypothetical protein
VGLTEICGGIPDKSPFGGLVVGGVLSTECLALSAKKVEEGKATHAESYVIRQVLCVVFLTTRVESSRRDLPPITIAILLSSH